MNRLQYCLCLCIAAMVLSASLLLFANSPTMAAPPGEEARMALQGNVNGIITLLASSEFDDSSTRPVVKAKIEALLRNIFDFKEFSMRTVGPRWRTFNEDQQTRFADAFATLLRTSYLDKLESYHGESVEYAGERLSSDARRVEVNTFVILQDKKVPVSYRMLKKQGWVVYDVLIEGISLVKNYRTQFHELFRKESPDQIIARIKAKAQDLQKNQVVGE